MTEIIVVLVGLFMPTLSALFTRLVDEVTRIREAVEAMAYEEEDDGEPHPVEDTTTNPSTNP